MLDALLHELSDRYGLGDRSRDLFGLLMGYLYNDRRGGFDGFVESFRQQGHGDLLSSWLGGDARTARALTASDVGMVFGQGLLGDWGNRLGVSRATVAAAIAGILPRLIGELTPGGRLPGGFASVPMASIRNDTVEVAGPDPARTDFIDTPRPPSLPGHDAAQRHAQREPVFASNSQPAPVHPNATNLRRSDHRDDSASPAAIDPHVAAITAAVSASAPKASSSATDPSPRDFEFRRSPPPRKRGGVGWLVWLLILLGLTALAAFYLQQYPLLDGVALPWSVTSNTR